MGFNSAFKGLTARFSEKKESYWK